MITAIVEPMKSLFKPRDDRHNPPTKDRRGATNIQAKIDPSSTAC
jgi:hypothetical protein